MNSYEYHQEEIEQFHDQLEHKYARLPISTLLQEFAPKLYDLLLKDFIEGEKS